MAGVSVAGIRVAGAGVCVGVAGVRVADEAEGELGIELGDTGMTVDVDGAALGGVDATQPPMSKANNATVMLRAAGCRGFLMFFQTTERPRTFDLRRRIRTGPFRPGAPACQPPRSASNRPSVTSYPRVWLVVAADYAGDPLAGRRLGYAYREKLELVGARGLAPDKPGRISATQDHTGTPQRQTASKVFDATVRSDSCSGTLATRDAGLREPPQSPR